MSADTALHFSPDPTRSATLPGYYYVDPAIFERESEQIFYKSWQFVGFSFDLKNPGDYIAADILDQKVFVVGNVTSYVSGREGCLLPVLCFCG